MNDAASPAVRARIPTSNASQAWPGIAFTVVVLALSVYAFAPRPDPEFKPTQVYADKVIVNGLAAVGSRYVAVGEQGLILTGDGGEQWGAAKVDPQRGSTLTAVHALDDKVVLAVGHDGWILRSEDGGQSFREIAFDAAGNSVLLGVAGPYDGKVFAFGSFGFFTVSTDQGKTWTPATPPALSDRHLNAMTQAGNGSLFIVGERGLVAQSTDGGTTWTALREFYPGSFFGILSLPAAEGETRPLLVHGMRGHAFVSPDLGRTWNASEVPQTVSLFGGAVLPTGDVVLVGANNATFLSKDGGKSFETISERAKDALAAVLPLPSGQLLTGGEGGIHQRGVNFAGAPGAPQASAAGETP